VDDSAEVFGWKTSREEDLRAPYKSSVLLDAEQVEL
jgi:hypothetical protein